MKKIKCYDCEKEFSAESADDALKQMHPHYMEEHKDLMAGASEEKKKVWMEQFHKDWEEAPEAQLT